MGRRWIVNRSPCNSVWAKFRNHQTCRAWIGARLPFRNTYHKGFSLLIVLMGGSLLAITSALLTLERSPPLIISYYIVRSLCFFIHLPNPVSPNPLHHSPSPHMFTIPITFINFTKIFTLPYHCSPPLHNSIHCTEIWQETPGSEYPF